MGVLQGPWPEPRPLPTLSSKVLLSPHRHRPWPHATVPCALSRPPLSSAAGSHVGQAAGCSPSAGFQKFFPLGFSQPVLLGTEAQQNLRLDSQGGLMLTPMTIHPVTRAFSEPPQQPPGLVMPQAFRGAPERAIP